MVVKATVMVMITVMINYSDGGHVPDSDVDDGYYGIIMMHCNHTFQV